VDDVDALRNEMAILRTGRASSARPVEDQGTRARTLRSAITLIGDQGLAATTMRDLATAVGVQPPALYNHFASKEQILGEAMEHALAEFVETVDPALEEETALGRLESVVRLHTAFQLRHPDLARANDLLMQAERVQAFLPVDIHERIERAQRAYARLVRALIRNVLPPASPIDPVVAAFAVIGVCDRVTLWYRPEGRIGQEDVVEQTWWLVRQMLGIAAQPLGR
jgi:AcrR family transcriptional regulator